jgi:hypothetical protein
MISNTFLTGLNSPNPFNITEKSSNVTVKEDTGVIDNLSLANYKAENNNPLCRLTGNCTDITNLPPTDPEPPVDPEYPPAHTAEYIAMNNALTSVTFERIYKNMGSFPVTTDKSNKKLMTKTYKINSTDTVLAVIDRTIKNKIVTTLTGKTGYPKPLIKTILLDGADIINTTYTFGV